MTPDQMTDLIAREKNKLHLETDRLCGGDTAKQVARIHALEQELAIMIAASEHRLGAADAAHAEAINAELDRLMATTPSPRLLPPDGTMGDWSPPSATAGQYLDQAGRPVHCLSPDQRLVDLPAAGGGRFEGLSLGKLIIGAATGRWKNAEREQLAMSESWNASGGFLVEDKFTRGVLDYARNKSAVLQAGGKTVTWDASDTLRMARVKADPVFEVKSENSAFSEKTLSFEAITFTASKIGTIIVLSRELADDAPNVVELIEATLAEALAVEIDRLALVGSGSAEPNGLAFYTGVTSTGSIGAIDWADVHAGAVAVRNGNFEPNAYICSPTIAGDLDLLAAGDGVTSSKTWLGAPPSLQNVRRFTTKNAGDDRLFVGDWSQFVFAVRQGVQLEISTQGDYFKAHQVAVKVTWRGDVGVLNPAAFHFLSGITT